MTCRRLQQRSPLGCPPLLTSPPPFPSSPSSGSSLDDRVLQSSVLHPLLSLSFLPGSCHPLKAFTTTDILVSPKLASSFLVSLSASIFMRALCPCTGNSTGSPRAGMAPQRGSSPEIQCDGSPLLHVTSCGVAPRTSRAWDYRKAQALANLAADASLKSFS